MARRNNGGLSFRKKKRLSDEIKLLIRNYFIGCIVAAILGILLVLGFGYAVNNVGVSMEPTIAHNQKVLVNRAAYLILPPKAGDVIVFKQGSNHMYIKRVVAVSGDTVQIKDGHLYVNHVMVKDDYDKIADPGIADQKITLEKDQFFVMGDNRNNSEDSRAETIGAIQRNQIIGQVWFALPAEYGKMKPVK